MKKAINSADISLDLIPILEKSRKETGITIKPNVLIIGDTPLDVYWICRTSLRNFHQDHSNSIKQSHFDVLQEIRRPGTVYAIAKLFKEFGFPVSVVTCIGEDNVGNYIKTEYNKLGVNLIAPIIKGASFQRHYILNEVDSSNPFQGIFGMVQRVNHEPTFDFKATSKKPINQTIHNEIKNALIGCEYIMINDTQKGTLTTDFRSDTNSEIQPGILYSCFTQNVKSLNKKITILDSRKSLRFYKGLKTRFLTSSAYEVHMSLSHPNYKFTNQISADLLEKNLLEELLHNYSEIENWALTRSSAGVQIGIRDENELAIHCHTQPSITLKPNCNVFTPHCGDFFDVGVVIGISYGLNLVESTIFGSFFGGLQAQESYAKVITKETIWDAIDCFSTKSKYPICLNYLFSIEYK